MCARDASSCVSSNKHQKRVVGEIEIGQRLLLGYRTKHLLILNLNHLNKKNYYKRKKIVSYDLIVFPMLGLSCRRNYLLGYTAQVAELST